MSGMLVWIALAISLFIIELLTGTVFFLILAMSSLIGAGVNLLTDNAAWSIMTAAISAIAGCAALAVLRQKTRRRHDDSDKLQNADIGQRIHVDTWNGDRARVQYRGTFWDARTADGSAGTAGDWTIVRLEGNRLILNPVQGE